jgi:hypothetical protein
VGVSPKELFLNNNKGIDRFQELVKIPTVMEYISIE